MVNIGEHCQELITSWSIGLFHAWFHDVIMWTKQHHKIYQLYAKIVDFWQLICHKHIDFRTSLHISLTNYANKCTMGWLWNLPVFHLQHNLLQGNEAFLLAVWFSSMPCLELFNKWASCISTQHFIMEIGNVSSIDTQP